MALLSSQPRSRAADAILAGLNRAQREAAMASEGPVSVIAGASTGKTLLSRQRAKGRA